MLNARSDYVRVLRTRGAWFGQADCDDGRHCRRQRVGIRVSECGVQLRHYEDGGNGTSISSTACRRLEQFSLPGLLVDLEVAEAGQGCCAVSPFSGCRLKDLRLADQCLAPGECFGDGALPGDREVGDQRMLKVQAGDGCSRAGRGDACTEHAVTEISSVDTGRIGTHYGGQRVED